MQRTVQLPFGPCPGWECEETDPDAAGLKTVSQSLAVLQSLKQSRSKWLTSNFPKFSTKARSKAAEIATPPHSTKAHGKHDLSIGPHLFPNTAIYEVHYLPSADLSNGGQSNHIPDAQSSLPVMPSSIDHVTPTITSQVAVASRSDPILANLLNAVVTQTATEDQVKTLGLLIQSLEGVQQYSAANATPSVTPLPPPYVRAGSPKPFDIILEFHERPYDKWIFPRGDIFCERPGIAQGTTPRVSDVIITTCLPFPGVAIPEPSAFEGQPSDPPHEVVSFRLSRVSPQFWDLLVTWAGGSEKMEESKTKLAEMVKQAAPPSYLQHRLPDGELLSQIQSALAPPYTTKPIKPAGADSNRTKRKSITRKATVVINDPSSPGQKAAPAKRRQQLKAKAPAPPPISCHSCGQTNVPLMMGGRYCRICIDTDTRQALPDIPQVPSALSQPTPPTPIVPSDDHEVSVPHSSTLTVVAMTSTNPS